MKKTFILILLGFGLTVLTGLMWKQKTAVTPDVCISAEEQKLYTILMEYRKKNKLPVIPLSKSLTYVAQQHCLDLYKNKPDTNTCNTHSWSDKGKWTPCCYTPDHAQAAGMWSKPKELTSYTDYGFEIAMGSSGMTDDYAMTAELALKGWQGSQGHNNVILNKDIWKDRSWKAIGIAVYKGYSVVWFGGSLDKEKTPGLCK
jgi:uncharacterized protein YkwD